MSEVLFLMSSIVAILENCMVYLDARHFLKRYLYLVIRPIVLVILV